jgi:hypothetical protein
MNPSLPHHPPRVFTWHVHGSYLYYLSQANCQFFIPKRPDGSPGYGGRAGSFAWGANVIEVPEAEVKQLEFDAVLFQSRRNYEIDQYDTLSAAQRRLPQLYLEHDPPQEHPTNTKHWFGNPAGRLIHVTHFNRLMWDSGSTPTTVIEHGVTAPAQSLYTGELERGLVIVNNLPRRGRRLGLDVFEQARHQLPIDLVGMGSEVLGGLGEIPLADLPAFAGRYRFMFNPIRYTSLGLAVCEAMAAGIPIVGLATTEMATVIQNDVNGYTDTNVDTLITHMHQLLASPATAWRLSAGARATALQRFDIERFSHNWEQVVAGTTRATQSNPQEVLP